MSLSGVVNPAALQSYEMAENHGYEDISKFQKEEGEYSVIGPPERSLGPCYENINNSIVAFEHPYSPPPTLQPLPVSYSSKEGSTQPIASQEMLTQQTGSESEVDMSECAAYIVHSQLRNACQLSTEDRLGDPLYDN